MKKATMILSFFLLACAGVSIAQTKIPVKAVAAAPAGSNAGKPKPKPKPKPAPKPSSSTHDIYIEIDDVKGEVKGN